MQDLEYKTQHIANGVVGYVCFGEGTTPLVMLIGYTGTLFHWNKTFTKQLSKAFKVYLLDNRYIGLTKTTNNETMFGMAQDVSQFIEAVGLVKPWVLGWSMGGMVAQELASFYAYNLSGMILVATTPSYSYVNVDFIDLLINANNMPEKKFKQELYRFFFSDANFENRTYNLRDNALNLLNYPYVYTKEARDFQDMVAVSWQGLDEERYNTITLPILFIKSKDDLVVTNEAPLKLLEWAKNANYIEYNEGGHFLVHKNSVLIADDIINFYNKTSS
jgi:pimeloyl-ACP methyl ester carboxylesterase